MMQLPEDYMPEWAKYIIATVLGAGGLHWFRAWLENRRLAKKDFRELLLDRIRELEGVVAQMQVRMGNLRVEMAHLETENRALKRALRVADGEVEDRDADERLDRGADSDEPA
jgi:hypothetical protein